MIQFLEVSTPNEGCLVTNRSDLPVIDFGARASGLDPKVVLSVPVLQQAAEALGYVTNEQLAEVVEENVSLRDRVEELEREALELDAALQAVDVIESAGFRARKKPGRAPKQREEVSVGA